MGFLDSLERGLERAVNSAFARTFRSGVQPVEIAAALKRELDIKAVATDRDRVLAPNIFTVRLAAKDNERLQQLGQTLINELTHAVQKHAANQGYQLLGAPYISFETAQLTPGTLEVVSETPTGEVTWAAILEVEGKRYRLQPGTTIVGRGTESQIRISDTAASRRHLEIIWDGKNGLVRDLGSTNGSKIAGQRFKEVALQPDTIIDIGKTQLRFSFAPQSRATQPAAASSSTPAASFWEVK